jgi:subtilisin family serine protease
MIGGAALVPPGHRPRERPLKGEDSMRSPGWKVHRRARLAWFAGLVALAAALTTAATASPAQKLQASQAGITVKGTYSAAKSPTSQLAQTDPRLLGLTSSKPIPVMLKYDFDATASYAGGVEGLAATSPRVTGETLSQNASAVSAYDSYAKGLTSKIDAAVTRAVPGISIHGSYQTVYGGVSAVVPGNQISKLLSVPGVVAVQRDALQHPLDDNTSFIGAQTVWPSLGGSQKAGRNVVLGVLDTGVWPEHPMLSPTGISAPPRPLSAYHCDFGDGTDTANLGPTFTCNNKLIGAYAFTQTYMSVLGSDGQEFCDNVTGQCSARDPEGHGTHTMTTAAGDCVSSAILYGVNRGPVCGIAPGAHVIEYRVCLSQGCFDSDSVAAVQQAITDGVNVISFSISGGADPYTDPVELAFLDAWNAGITIAAAAGNSGPGAGTSDHGGPWVITVGATTGPRQFSSTLHLTADGGAKFDMPGVTLTNGIGSATPVVLAQNIPGEDVLCQTPLVPGTATGEIVACERGVNARVDKGYNVYLGGATGMILYNPINEDVESDNHWLPSIHLNGPDTGLLNFINGHTNVRATWAQGAPAPDQPDVMAAFSSRGPQGDWIKPDISAPGVQVLAGMTPQPDETTPTDGPPGNLYQAIAGTSMATPHVAGAAVLVKAAHPQWTPAEIKSALMTSAAQGVVKEDGTTPASPFDTGSGRVQVDRAVNPTLVFNESYAHMVAAGSDTLDRINLNIPSIDATTMSGEVTTTRTAINVGTGAQNMAVSIDEPAGVTITVGTKNRNLHFPAGGRLTFPITISAPTVADGQYFASITLTPEKGGNAVYIPVAFVKKQGNVTLTSTCSPTSFPATRTKAPSATHCSTTVTNLGSTAANASLNVSQLEKGHELRYKNVGLPGSVIGSGDGVQWVGPLTAALAPPVESIATGGEPYGYVPLSALGVTPLSGVGDETISDLATPTYYFGGETYNEIGMVSDGYVVIGGGDSTDINYLPQTFPDPTAPNNVVAPFWTDLNPSFGGNMYAASITDGTDNWIVCDWESVRNYDTADTHTFEVWIRLPGGTGGTGAGSEQITMNYGANGVQDPDNPPGDSNWGGENRDGSSGISLASYPGDGSSLAVNMGAPTPGGSVTIPYDIASRKTGTYTSQATMTSNQTVGKTEVETPLTVTP